MNRAHLILLSCLLLAFCSFKKEEHPSLDYINKYKDFAIVEMKRSGIPASIKFGQALIETGNGKSRLANVANNHFGIKCKSYWTGKTYFTKDDDRDEQGKLIKSCFRSYDHAFDSFIDHSNFLKHTPHYSRLFELSKTDYKGWAHTLKACGYATAPKYAENLIRKIEELELYRLDTAE